MNKGFWATQDPQYDAWIFGDKKKLSPELRELRNKFDALNPQEKINYCYAVRDIKKRFDELHEILEHPDNIKTFKKEPATVHVYTKGDMSIVTTECTECNCSPCKHTGTNFTKAGLLDGVFPGEKKV